MGKYFQSCILLNSLAILLEHQQVLEFHSMLSGRRELDLDSLKQVQHDLL